MTPAQLASESENFLSFFTRQENYFRQYSIYAESFQTYVNAYDGLFDCDKKIQTLFGEALERIKSSLPSTMCAKLSSLKDALLVPLLHLFSLSQLVEAQRKVVAHYLAFQNSLHNVSDFSMNGTVSAPKTKEMKEAKFQSEFTLLLVRVCKALRTFVPSILAPAIGIELAAERVEQIGVAILYMHPATPQTFYVGERAVLISLTDHLIVCRLSDPCTLTIAGNYRYDSLSFFKLGDYLTRYPACPSKRLIRLHFIKNRGADGLQTESTLAFSMFTAQDHAAWCSLFSSKLSQVILKNNQEINGIAGDKPVVKSLYGVPLQTIAAEQSAVYPTLHIPFLLQIIMRNIFLRGMCEEGIARLAGTSAVVKEFTDHVEKNQISFSAYTPFDLFSVLKKFMDQLPEPLLTSALVNEWVALNDITDDQEKLWKAKTLLTRLPVENYNILKEYLFLLYQITLSKNVNKMSPSNLALVAVPFLLKTRDTQVGEVDMIQFMKQQSDLGLYLIDNYKTLFPYSFVRQVGPDDPALYTRIYFNKKLYPSKSPLVDIQVHNKKLYALDKEGTLVCYTLPELHFEGQCTLGKNEPLGFFFSSDFIYIVTKESVTSYSVGDVKLAESDVKSVAPKPVIMHETAIKMFYFDEGSSQLYIVKDDKVIYYDLSGKSRRSDKKKSSKKEAERGISSPEKQKKFTINVTQEVTENPAESPKLKANSSETKNDPASQENAAFKQSNGDDSAKAGSNASSNAEKDEDINVESCGESNNDSDSETDAESVRGEDAANEARDHSTERSAETPGMDVAKNDQDSEQSAAADSLSATQLSVDNSSCTSGTEASIQERNSSPMVPTGIAEDPKKPPTQSKDMTKCSSLGRANGKREKAMNEELEKEKDKKKSEKKSEKKEGEKKGKEKKEGKEENSKKDGKETGKKAKREKSNGHFREASDIGKAEIKLPKARLVPSRSFDGVSKGLSLKGLAESSMSFSDTRSEAYQYKKDQKERRHGSTKERDDEKKTDEKKKRRRRGDEPQSLHGSTTLMRLSGMVHGAVSALRVIGGAVWIGTEDGEVLRMEDGRCVARRHVHEDCVHDIVEVAGNVWTCARDATVGVLTQGGELQRRMLAHFGAVGKILPFSDAVLTLGDETHLWGTQGDYRGCIFGIFTDAVTSAVTSRGNGMTRLFMCSKDGSLVEMDYFDSAIQQMPTTQKQVSLSMIVAQTFSVLASPFALQSVNQENDLRPIALCTATPHRITKSHAKTITGQADIAPSAAMRNRYTSMLSSQIVGKRAILKRVDVQQQQQQSEPSAK